MRKQATRSLILAVAGFMLCGAAQAQVIHWDSYAVKFACGNVFSETNAMGVNGKYWTTINIHNPHNLEVVGPAPIPVPLQFFKKIVLAQPQGSPILPHSCHLEELLESDLALSVNCNNIRAQLAFSGLPSTGPLDGFVVLQVPPLQGSVDETPPELDVTVLYTGRFTGQPANPANGLNTWDVEQVEPKIMRGLPNLSLCVD